MTEKLHQSEQDSASGKNSTAWDDMSRAPFAGEQLPTSTAKEFIQRVADSSDYAGVRFNENHVLESDHPEIVTSVRAYVETIGAQKMLDINKSFVNFGTSTSPERNEHLADALYEELDEKATRAKDDFDDVAFAKYTALGQILADVERAADIYDDGSQMSLYTAAKKIILQKNRDFIYKIRDGKATEAIEDKYALDISLLEDMRNMLKNKKNTLRSHDRTSNDSSNETMEMESVPVGKSPEEQAREAQ